MYQYLFNKGLFANHNAGIWKVANIKSIVTCRVEPDTRPSTSIIRVIRVNICARIE